MSNLSEQENQGFLNRTLEASKEGLGNLTESASNLASNVNDSTQGMIQSVRENVSNTMGDYSNVNVAEASQEFLDSNTIISKIGFIILVLIIFFFSLRISMALLGYLLSPSSTPFLVKGMMPGNKTTIISQNPDVTKHVNILRSNNQTTGVEFTWSVWLLVNPDTSKTSGFQNVFVKGDGFFGSKDLNSNGLSMVENGPGMYLINDKDSNGDYTGVTSLVAVMDIHEPNAGQPNYELLGLPMNSPYVLVNNIPIGTWFHVALRLENTLLDIYINGVLTSRTVLQDVPRQNYGDVTVAGNGGFQGQLSNLRYYPYALNVFQISSIAWFGPDVKISSLANSSQANNGYTYLSSAWYNNNL